MLGDDDPVIRLWPAFANRLQLSDADVEGLFEQYAAEASSFLVLLNCIATETSPLGSPAPALSFLTRGCDVPGSQPDDRGEHAGLPYRHRDSLSDEAVNCGRGRGGRHRHILDNNISKIAEFIAFSLEQRVNYIVKVIYLPWRA